MKVLDPSHPDLAGELADPEKARQTLGMLRSLAGVVSGERWYVSERIIDRIRYLRS